VLDSSQNPIPVTTLVNGAGRVAVQFPVTQPGASYYVRLSANSESSLGNYEMSVQASHSVATSYPVTSGILPAFVPNSVGHLIVTQNSLYFFSLQTVNLAAGATLHFTITNQVGHTVQSLLSTSPGLVTGLPVLLAPGVYTTKVSSQ